jgi:hypothetical protein
MRNLTLNDETQQEVLRHLVATEKLLAQVATKLSGSKMNAEIVAMPDLGFPSNVRRAHGGFYTGAYYSWKTSVPFVPVDATVNCCGVSLWQLKSEISSEEDFLQRVEDAKLAMKETEYIWNYQSGNHFITYGTISGSDTIKDGAYLVMHSSASEYKKQQHGLYPEPSNWYADSIEVEHGEDGRYLRYISGDKAIQFAAIAKKLEGYNCERHRWLVGKIAGSDGILEEVLNIQHYGMPDQNSVAIGCQWIASNFLLLTAPELPIYLVRPGSGGDNMADNFLLTPHGLGMRATKAPHIEYGNDVLRVNGLDYSFAQAMKGSVGMELRGFVVPENGEIPEIVSSVLEKCPGEVIATFMPKYSYR